MLPPVDMIPAEFKNVSLSFDKFYVNIDINEKIINGIELFAVNIEDDFKLFIYYILFVLYI